MDVRVAGRKVCILFSLTVRSLLMTRRGIATISLAATPVVIVGGLALAQSDSLDIFLFQILMVPLFLQVVVIFVTLVAATALIREEIEDNTLPYLLTRPVSKPAILWSKFSAYLAAVLLLLIPSVLFAYVVTQGYAGNPLSADRDVLFGFLIATSFGAAAYGAFFLLLSILVRRPLPAGLLFGFVWEFGIGSIPGDFPRLSIIHYLRSVLKELAPIGPLGIYPSNDSAMVASVVLVGFTVAALLLSTFLFQQQEFRQKA
jgi:ABC-2 type transport system permease protein